MLVYCKALDNEKTENVQNLIMIILTNVSNKETIILKYKGGIALCN